MRQKPLTVTIFQLLIFSFPDGNIWFLCGLVPLIRLTILIREPRASLMGACSCKRQANVLVITACIARYGAGSLRTYCMRPEWMQRCFGCWPKMDAALQVRRCAMSGVTRDAGKHRRGRSESMDGANPRIPDIVNLITLCVGVCALLLGVVIRASNRVDQ